jgi:transcriptional regulator with XRE-family HTH domain
MRENTKSLNQILNEVHKEYPVHKSQVALQGLFIDIALAIAKMRDNKGISQRELAKMLDTAQSTVARWETPGYSSYNLTKLAEIADVLEYNLQLAFTRKQIVDTKVVEYNTWHNAGRVSLSTETPFRPVKQWSPQLMNPLTYIQEVAI